MSSSPKPQRPVKTSVPTEVRLNITLPPTQFPILLFVNKVGLESVGSEPLVHFGLVSESGGILAQFATIFDRDMIRYNLGSWSDFIARNPPLADQNVDFSFRCAPPRLNSVPVTSVAQWSLSGIHGEVRLFAVLVGEVKEVFDQHKDTIGSQPLAAIRMPSHIQHHLLATLLTRYAPQT